MKFTTAPTVVSRQVGDETMLMDLQTGTYFGLDPIGGRIWQAIEDGQDIASLCAMLAEEFDVSHDQISKDVSALVEALSEQNLIEAARR